MQPVKFSKMNAVFKADGCDDLPALKRAHESTGLASVTSCWKPGEDELAILNSGGCVCLSVIGGQPPVALWAQEVDTVD